MVRARLYCRNYGQSSAGVGLSKRSRHEAPTDQASERLLHGASEHIGGGLKDLVCALLCHWHLSGERLPPNSGFCRSLPS